MADRYTFTQARNRLEDIVSQVRKKDVSLEHSLDLLEEGVKLAASCTELIDHTEWRSVVEELQAEAAEGVENIADDEAGRSGPRANALPASDKAGDGGSDPADPSETMP